MRLRQQLKQRLLLLLFAISLFCGSTAGASTAEETEISARTRLVATVRNVLRKTCAGRLRPQLDDRVVGITSTNPNIAAAGRKGEPQQSELLEKEDALREQRRAEPVGNKGGRRKHRNMLDDIKSSEPALMMFGNQQLNANEGILSFLSAADAGALLNASKLHSQKDAEGKKVAVAALAQNTDDRTLANRTESCEDLFLEVLREKVGTKLPRDYWNADIDLGRRHLQSFQRMIEGPESAAPPNLTPWSVRLLMTMARETCNPATAYQYDFGSALVVPRKYSSTALSSGCHKNDRGFFREVLEFFHENAPENRKSIASRLRRTGTDSAKLVKWTPPETLAFSRATDDSRLSRVNMALNPNQGALDSRCRLAMATEFLFQKEDDVYNVEFPVKYGYCLNPWDYFGGSRNRFMLEDPIDEGWYPYFRRVFRQFKRKWRAGSDGTKLHWSYNQFQWDWRSCHAKRLGALATHKFLERMNKPPKLPAMLAARPADFLVAKPSKIADDLC
ncbi:unnamed protein product [Amoebophrya sp. A120]|nr:unnamed protein product [Amoebophrya sp. A120]|eukprot:GSA120T00025169001.1